MVRKIFLTGVVLFLGQGSNAQLAMAMLMASYFMALHIRCMPFISNQDDVLQSVSLISSVLTLTMAMLLKASTNAKEGAIAGNAPLDRPPPMLLVFVNAITTVLALYMAAMKLRDQIQTQIGLFCSRFAVVSAVCTVLWTSVCVMCFAAKRYDDARENANYTPNLKVDTTGTTGDSTGGEADLPGANGLDAPGPHPQEPKSLTQDDVGTDGGPAAPAVRSSDLGFLSEPTCMPQTSELMCTPRTWWGCCAGARQENSKSDLNLTILPRLPAGISTSAGTTSDARHH